MHLRPDYILLDEHDIVTAGGVMAWVNLGVHLVQRWMGPDVVSRVCRQMLIDPTGKEQRNYRSFRPNLTHTDDVIRNLQIWMEGPVDADLSGAVLARRAGLSLRTLQRRFSDNAGCTPSQYVQELRMEKAKGLLEQTSQPVSQICWAVGYHDVSAFCRLFKSVSGLSTSEYRQRFRII